MQAIRRTAAILALVVGTACASGDEAGPITAPSAPSSTTTAPPGTTISTAASATSTPALPDIELRGDGIDLFDLGVSNAPDVLARFIVLLGPPLKDDATECPSGSDRIVRWDEIYLVFGDDRLRGYFSNRPSPAGISTVEGIGLGSNFSDVEDAYGADNVIIQETSLGWEFFVGDGGLRGFTDGPAPSATVTGIGAGDLCAFR